MAPTHSSCIMYLLPLSSPPPISYSLSPPLLSPTYSHSHKAYHYQHKYKRRMMVRQHEAEGALADVLQRHNYEFLSYCIDAMSAQYDFYCKAYPSFISSYLFCPLLLLFGLPSSPSSPHALHRRNEYPV